MTDIVERLHRYNRDMSRYAECCHRASDEIEALLAQVIELEASNVLERQLYDSRANEIEEVKQALAAERAISDKLEKALSETQRIILTALAELAATRKGETE